MINELTSRHSGKMSNILEIKAENKIVSNPVDIAETINEHLTNIEQVLAEDITGVDVNPEVYLETTDKSFSLQTPSIDIVLNILKNIENKKATGLDKIPSKLLKTAAGIIRLPPYSPSPSSLGYTQANGKRPK